MPKLTGLLPVRFSKPAPIEHVSAPTPAANNAASLAPTAQTVLNRAARAERRRAVRHKCEMHTACVVISLVEPVLLSVRVRDISQSGIGLILSNRVQPGTFLAVKLQGPRHPAPRVLRAQVIHATAQGDRRTWLLGCHFVGVLAKEELSLLI